MGKDERERDDTAGGAVVTRDLVEDGEQRRIDAVSGHHPTTTEGTPGEDSRPVVHRTVEHAVSGRSGRHHREFGLDRCDRLTEMDLECGDLRGRVVRDSDRTDETPFPQGEERACHLRWMGQQIGSVHHVEIHRRDAESTQRGLTGFGERGRTAVVGDARSDPSLGDEEDAVAECGSSGENLSQSLLTCAPARATPVEAVHIGGVDEGASEVDRPLHHARRVIGGGGGEAPATEAETAHRATGDDARTRGVEGI